MNKHQVFFEAFGDSTILVLDSSDVARTFTVNELYNAIVARYDHESTMECLAQSEKEIVNKSLRRQEALYEMAEAGLI